MTATSTVDILPGMTSILITTALIVGYIALAVLFAITVGLARRVSDLELALAEATQKPARGPALTTITQEPAPAGEPFVYLSNRTRNPRPDWAAKNQADITQEVATIAGRRSARRRAVFAEPADPIRTAQAFNEPNDGRIFLGDLKGFKIVPSFGAVYLDHDCGWHSGSDAGVALFDMAKLALDHGRSGCQ